MFQENNNSNFNKSTLDYPAERSWADAQNEYISKLKQEHLQKKFVAISKRADGAGSRSLNIQRRKIGETPFKFDEHITI